MARPRGHRGEDLFPAEGPAVHHPRPVRPLLTLLLVALLTASTGLVAASPAGATTSRATRMLTMVNTARAAHGLQPLVAQADLRAAARAHTRSMAGARTLFHTPSFATLCCWRAVAENVGYGSTVRGLHRQLMRSAPHRANILSPGMRHVGISMVRQGGVLWVTQVFRDPAP